MSILLHIDLIVFFFARNISQKTKTEAKYSYQDYVSRELFDKLINIPVRFDTSTAKKHIDFHYILKYYLENKIFIEGD